MKAIMYTEHRREACKRMLQGVGQAQVHLSVFTSSRKREVIKSCWEKPTAGRAHLVESKASSSWSGRQCLFAIEEHISL